MGDTETEENLPQHNAIKNVYFTSVLSYNIKKLINTS